MWVDGEWLMAAEREMTLVIPRSSEKSNERTGQVFPGQTHRDRGLTRVYVYLFLHHAQLFSHRN